MSKFGEAILKPLVLAWQSRHRHGATRNEGWEDYFQWQLDSTSRLLKNFSRWSPKDKTILEIGCGTGGRSAYLGTTGAKRVLGIDINAEEIGIARQLLARLHPELCEKVEYLECAENEPLDIGTFDIVVLIDTIEHVVSPPAMMRLAHRYLKDGGQFYFTSIGWYHHGGSHLGLLPFVNVFFSDETILNVMRWCVSRPQYVPSRFDSDPPVERWRGLYDLRDRPGEYLNKLTIRQVKKLMKHSIFSESRMTVVGFSRKHLLARLLQPLRHVPLLQELFHSVVIVECRKH